jgi:uncharacterized protein with von Willebrand factor type A (vWA) domain
MNVEGRRGGGSVESDLRYFLRRAACEQAAADRAVTPEARERRLMLVNSYQGRVNELRSVAR